MQAELPTLQHFCKNRAEMVFNANEVPFFIVVRRNALE